MRFGVQLASFLFLLTILFNYFRHKRLPLKSTHFFAAFLIVSLSNLIFEGLTLYTINNLDSVSSFFNRFAHQLFIGTINLEIVMLYFYLDLKSRNQKKYNKLELTIRLLPAIICLFFVIFGPLKYDLDAKNRYSYGAMANTIYISVALYLVFAIISIIRNHKRFNKQELISIGLGIASWAIISLIQLFNPTLLLSSLAIVLMVDFLFISFENSEKYLVDRAGYVFSNQAFELTVNEYLQKEHRFYIINFLISNYDKLLQELGSDTLSNIINEFAGDVSRSTKGSVFISRDNAISIITEDANEYSEKTSEKTRVEQVNYNKLSIKLRFLIKGIDGTTYQTLEEVEKEMFTIDDSIKAYKDDKLFQIPIKDIYYIEVIDNESFIYTKKEFYVTNEKLYKLEESLLLWNFVRASKSMICNSQKVLSVSKETNSRLIAFLNNDESIIVSRQYVKDFRAKVKL